MGPWHSRRLSRVVRVRFGVPLDQVCKHNIIPRPLLEMILKLNKDAPFRKNVFRAPGPEASVKKAVSLLQKGYFVETEELSVYTLASVVKKFLRKLPGGVFGSDNEEELFGAMELSDSEERLKRIYRVTTVLSLATQRLLVLLFGTFRAIADTASWAETGMTAEALGVSVAPSIFRSCVSGGKMATMEDVIKFKVATRLTKYLIEQFGHAQLFSTACYDYYTRMTGRPRPGIRDWRRGIYTSVSAVPGLPLLPARVKAQDIAKGGNTDKQSIHSDVSPVSAAGSSDDTTSSPTAHHSCNLTMAQLKTVNQHAESTRELTYLPQVHERQVARLRSRLEWYSSPGSSPAIFTSSSKHVCKISEPPISYEPVPNIDMSIRSQST